MQAWAPEPPRGLEVDRIFVGSSNRFRFVLQFATCFQR